MLSLLILPNQIDIVTIRDMSFCKRIVSYKDITWEQRKFGDVGSVSMCKRIFKNETSDGGDIPFYKIGTFGGEPDAYISRELFEEYKKKFSLVIDKIRLKQK